MNTSDAKQHKSVVQPRDATRPAGYSQAIRVGNTLYISGQVAWDAAMNVVGEGDPEAQTVQCFRNLEAVLMAAGGGLSDIVKLTYFAVGAENYQLVRKARIPFIPDPPPAGTGVIVAGLVDPKLLIEIEAIAVLNPLQPEGKGPGEV